MAEPPDLENLARRYIALWQEQMTAMVADPELAAAFGRLFGVADPDSGSAAAPMAWMAGLGRVPGGPPDMGGWAFEAAKAAFAANAAAGAAAGTASAAAAPDDGGALLRRLDRRLAALEERFAAVEAELARGGAKPRKSGRKRKS